MPNTCVDEHHSYNGHAAIDCELLNRDRCTYVNPYAISPKPCGGPTTVAFWSTKNYNRCRRCGHVTPA